MSLLDIIYSFIQFQFILLGIIIKYVSYFQMPTCIYTSRYVAAYNTEPKVSSL